MKLRYNNCCAVSLRDYETRKQHLRSHAKLGGSATCKGG